MPKYRVKANGYDDDIEAAEIRITDGCLEFLRLESPVRLVPFVIFSEGLWLKVKAIEDGDSQ